MSSVVFSQDSTNPAVRISIPHTNNDDGYLAQPTSARDFGGQLDSLQEADASIDDVSVTPRNGSRREGFNWGVQTTVVLERKYSRDPMPPAPLETRTPPPLQEIMRSMTVSRNGSTSDLRLERADSYGTDTTTIQTSTPPNNGDGLQRTETRKSSIAAFARGVAKHVPDMRMFMQSDNVADRRDTLRRRDSQDAELTLNSARDRKSSIALPSVLKSSHSYETAPNATSIIESPSQPSMDAPTVQPTAKGSLRDRRKVKLDLSMPPEIPDLPVRNRPPAIALSSITPSRPRSPKTPWIRHEPPSWDLGKLPRSAPIMEEGPTLPNGMGSGIISDVGLIPDSDAIISSQSPRFEHPSPRIQNRRYIPRPAHYRSRSGRSGTSDSGPSRAPNASASSIDTRAVQERQAQTAIELQQLNQATLPARQRRRWWKTSSDEGLQSPELTNQRFSLHLFKRPARCRTSSSTDTKTHCPVHPSSWRGKQIEPTLLPLAQIAAPPPFVPPGLQRVPTPPMFDSDGEVKGKLADFFFDVQGTSGLRKKTPGGVQGVWDSDALLMSVETDLTSSSSEEQEGPEGPAPLLARHNFDPAASLSTTTPMLGRDKWFGVEPGMSTPDETALTYLALQDEEAQRKFEWLVPEHLPSSPLCPLHRFYQGPFKGVCYWHRPKITAASRRSSWARGKQRVSGEVERSWNIDKEMGNGKIEGGQPVRRGSRGWRVGKFDSPPPPPMTVREESVGRPRLASLEGTWD